jgi:hypothetical protein
MMTYGRGERWFFIAFGMFVAGFSTIAVVSGIVGDAHPSMFAIGPLLIAAGACVVWMGVKWVSDGDDGRVGGGPLMSMRLAAEERVTTATAGVYHALRRPFGRVSASLENAGGKVYLTDRRIIYCPMRLAPHLHPISIPLREIQAVEDVAPRHLTLGTSGLTLRTVRGVTSVLWIKDAKAKEQIIAAAGNGESAPEAPATYGVRVSRGALTYAVAVNAAAAVVGAILIFAVDTPTAIIAFFAFSMFAGLLGLTWTIWQHGRGDRDGTGYTSKA